MALAHVAYWAQCKELAWSDVVAKLNKMDWSFENPIFFNLLVTGTAKKKMITGKESIKAAGQVIAYIVMGAEMTKTEVNEVKDIILNASNNTVDTLPEMI